MVLVPRPFAASARRFAFAVAAIACSVPSLLAADPAAVPSAAEMASQLASRQQGSAYVRLHLEVKQQGASKTLQLQIKERRTKKSAEVVCQVLWPKERKGESILLRKSGGTSSGTVYTPPDSMRSLSASQMKDAFFASDLAYEDMIDDFYEWESQAIVGTEVVNRVSCQILESKPSGGRSIYGKVRSWIDPRRMVPLRVEKYFPSGQLARRVETTRVASDDKGRSVPAYLSVRGPREDSVTEVDGNKIRHDITFNDREFTPDGLKEVAIPRGSPEN